MGNEGQARRSICERIPGASGLGSTFPYRFLPQLDEGVTMPRVIVIDKSVIDQINSGNADMARVVRDFVNAKSQIWMTRRDYNLLFRDAEQRMLGELGVIAPTQDVNPERYEAQLHPGPYAKSWVPHDNVPTAALALEKGAMVLSVDRKFTAAFAGAGGHVAPERASVATIINRANVGMDLNYSLGRRLLGLRPLNIGVNGRILPPPP